MTSLLYIDGRGIDTSILFFFFCWRVSNFCQSGKTYWGEIRIYSLFISQTMTLHFHLCANIIYTLSCVSLFSLAAAAKSARVGRTGPYTICLGLRPPRPLPRSPRPLPRSPRPLPRSPLSLSPPLDLLTVLPLGLLTYRSPRPRLPFPLPLTTGMS